jgi:hypothetical protein
MKKERQHIFDNPRNIKRLLRVFFTLCAVLLLLDVVHHRHMIHAWEQLWGFYGIFGFVACVALVLISKELRKVLMRPEDYYDDD